jgi:hypothetical protein
MSFRREARYGVVVGLMASRHQHGYDLTDTNKKETV